MPLLVGLAALACAKQVHPIHLTSVYTYSTPAARASVAVGADGTLEEHNLRLAQGGTEPSFVQTHSLLHGKQLAKLREHHKDVRSRTEQRSVAALEGHLVEQHSAHARRSWDVNVNGVIPLTNLRQPVRRPDRRRLEQEGQRPAAVADQRRLRHGLDEPVDQLEPLHD
jgi:hypothetical protein